MLTEDQMYSIWDHEITALYQADDFFDQFADDYSDYCDYSTDLDVLVSEDDTKSVEYEVTIDMEDIFEACMSNMHRWLNTPEVLHMFMNDDTYQYSESQYREFCQMKLVELIDAWFYDTPPATNLPTYSDFAYEYCEEHGNPTEYY